MKKSSMRPSQAALVLKEAIRKEVRKFLQEQGGLFSDDPGDSEQVSQDTAPEQSKNAQPTDKQVSLSKVSGSPDAGSGEPEEISLDSVVEKLNTIRSGRSFKDEQVMAQMEQYYNDLKDAEKKALQAFLSGISQIATGGVEGQQAQEPEDPPSNVKMVDKSNVKTRPVKPNVIKKGADGASRPSAEDTSPPISVKQR